MVEQFWGQSSFGQFWGQGSFGDRQFWGHSKMVDIRSVLQQQRCHDSLAACPNAHEVTLLDLFWILLVSIDALLS
jgi:hypothetical protein